MGAQNMTAKMTFASILFSLFSAVTASKSNAMPTNHRLPTLEAQDGCAKCQAAVYRDAGLENSRSEILQLAGLISADGLDPRVEQKQDGSDPMFMPIGRVNSYNDLPTGPSIPPGEPSGAAGTAFLISPCLIMTNQHVPYNGVLSPKGEPKVYRMLFEVGVKGKPGYASADATPVDHGSFGRSYQITDDWAILRLDPDMKTGKCLGEKLGWLNLSTKPVQTYMGVPFVSAGYPNDKKRNTLMVQKHCELNPTLDEDQNDSLETTCATLPGNSGGPIMKLVPGSAPIVVGITTTSADNSTVVQPSVTKRNANIAFDIYRSMRRKNQVEADIAGKHNPLDSAAQITSTKL